MDTNDLTHTMGCDPEVFIFDVSSYSAIPDIIPPAALVADYGIEFKEIDGKKVFIKSADYQWSEDGAAIELQMSPATNSNEFCGRVANSLKGLNKWLENISPKVGKTLSFSNMPLGNFDTEKYWKGRGEEFQDCVRFGCDPDQFPSMYIDMGLDRPSMGEIDVSTHPYRYGGGHLHIQAVETNPKVYFPIWEYAAIVFDFIVGMTNTKEPRSNDVVKQERARLEYYGKPGRIRLQAYNPKKGLFGIEYRVMSNYWLSTINTDFWSYGVNTRRFEVTLIDKLLVAADLAATLCESYGLAEIFVKEHEALIPAVYDSIMTLNKAKASEILGQVLSWLHSNDLVDIDIFSKLLEGRDDF